MTSKRVMGIILTLTLLLTSVGAFAYEPMNPQEAALMEYDDVMRLSGFGALWGLASYDDHTAAWILENFKIDQRDLEIDISDNFQDIARARVAAGDIPDYFVTLDRQLALEMAATGEFYDMAKDGLIYEYAPRLVDFIGKDLLDRFKNKDGELFIIPGQTAPVDNLTPYVYAQDAFMINVELLEKARLDAPKTVDELYRYLVTISEFEVDGQRVIPINNGSFRPASYNNTTYPIYPPRMLYMFSPGTTFNFLSKNDNTKMIEIYIDDPAYIEYLTFFNKLYREKLLDQDNFTLSQDQYVERLKTGVYGATSEGIAYAATANGAYSGKIDVPYWPIRFPRNYEGDANIYSFSVLGDWYTLYNKNISDPVRLAKLMNWNYTPEGTRVVHYGAPDSTLTKNCWYYDENGEIVFDQDLQQAWDAEDYTWNWMIAGGWGYHAIALPRCIKYTAVNEMGLLMADEMYIKVDEVTMNDLAIDPSFEAMTIEPMGEFFKNSGGPLCDLIAKWEVQIVLRAGSEEEVASMYEQMMEEVRAVGYDDMKAELYQMYLDANP